MASKRSISQIEDEELQAKLKEAFDYVDTEKKGSISKDDIRKVFETFGYQATEKALQVPYVLLKCKFSIGLGCIQMEQKTCCLGSLSLNLNHLVLYSIHYWLFGTLPFVIF